MNVQDNHVNTFITNQNFTETNNLIYLLGNDDTTEEIVEVKLSPYIDIQEFCEKLYNVKSNLSIMFMLFSDQKDISYFVHLCICMKKNYVAYMKLSIWDIF